MECEIRSVIDEMISFCWAEGLVAEYFCDSCLVLVNNYEIGSEIVKLFFFSFREIVCCIHSSETKIDKADHQCVFVSCTPSFRVLNNLRQNI